MIRRVTKVEYAPGQFLALPLYNAAQETSQGLNPLFIPMSGASYEYDAIGTGPATKSNAVERLSFLLLGDSGADINAQVDQLRAKLYVGGRLKVWTTGDEFDEYGDPFETERWAVARITAMPEIPVGVRNYQSLPVTVSLNRGSDWAGEDPIEPAPIAVAGSVVVNNPGTAPIRDVVITIDGSYSSLVITNTTNGKRLASSGSGSKIRFDAGRGAVERWNGSAWIGDYANFVRRTGQVHLMAIEPGDNVLTISGATGTIAVDGYPKYH